MKNYMLIIKIFAFLIIWLPSCSEDILDKTPLDKFSSATVWSDINLADVYLNYAYQAIGQGFGSPMLNSVSDEAYYMNVGGTDIYLLGNITADNLGVFSGSLGGTPVNWVFTNVQRINMFLDNIDKVVDVYPETQRESIKARADILKGEALFLRAYTYAGMASIFGGLPIMTKPWVVGDDYLSVSRGTFKETIDFIVEDCDAAAALLKSKDQMTLGKATNAAALALKSRILLFAASDLTADGTAEKKEVGYESPNRVALWTAARDAAKAVIDLNKYKLDDFGAPDKDAVAINCFSFFKQKTLANSEIIWGKMFITGQGPQIFFNRSQGPNGLDCYGTNNPNQTLIDEFQMEDGSNFFDHFFVDKNGYYKNKGTTKYKNENPYLHREPRFYGWILYDSAIWQKRFIPALIQRDPLGIYDRRTRRIVQGGVEINKLYGIDTRNGPNQAWNGSYSSITANTNVWIYFRYAEILLNYAEACMELGDNATAATYINMIRNRAGLPNFTGDIETALRHERWIELTYEGQRWFDIRRWKILENVLTNQIGIDIVETTNLDDGTVTTTWQRINCEARKGVKKMYWIPIPNVEIKKAPQLVQNPSY
jgi:hypothetical protein